MTVREWMTRLGAALGHGRRDQREDDLASELRFHQEMLEEAHRARGLDPDAARRAARLELGGEAQLAESWRDQRSLPFLETLRQDIRYGVRVLRRSPGFAATAIVTLALGIGANTAIFTIVDAVLLRPLPYANPDRLVTVGDRNPDGSSANAGFGTMAAWQDRSRTLEAFAAMRPWTPTLVTDGSSTSPGAGEAERIQAVRVSWNYFELLGARPMLGRAFTPEDDIPHDWPPYTILSESLWRRRFGADPAIVGRTVSLNDRAYRVVGVMPSSFEPLDAEKYYGAPPQLWAPLGSYMKGGTPASGSCRGCEQLRVFARLRPGATLAVATSEMDVIRGQLRRDQPGSDETGSIAVVSLRRALTSDVRPALLVLLGAVVFVLLIACANVASLLLARSVTRQRELTLRAALGAGRARLVRQLLTESLLLAGLAGTAGVLVAAIGVRGLAALAPAALPRLDHVALDGRVLVFTALVTLLTSVGCGLLPAWRGANRRGGSLTLDARGAVGHRSPARSVLVVADLTFALVLLAGAGLMLRTVAALTHANPGFTADGVLTTRFALTGRAYPSDEAMIAFEQRLLDRLRALPAVQAVAVAGRVPFTGVDGCWGFHAQGRSQANPADDPCVERYSFAGDYFRVMNIPVIAGRTFAAEDSASARRVILVSASTARLIWGLANPLGAQVRIGGATEGAWRTVVGVVGDVQHSDLTIPPAPAMYTPEAQITSAYLTLVARAQNGDASALAPDIRAAIRALDPIVPVYAVSPLSSLVRQSAMQQVFVTRVLSAFAAAAVLLAVVGLYGLVACNVAARTREVGVRVALGAQRADVARMVLSSGLWIVGAGVLAGLLAAAAGARFLTTLIFGVSPLDPLTMGSAAALLTIVALAAHWVPVRRALGIDPASALRAD